MKNLSVIVVMLAFAASTFLATGSIATAAAQTSTPAATPASAATGIDGAVAWLLTQQEASGAFVGFTGEPDAGVTLDAIVALAAAERAGVDTGDSVDRAVAWLGTGDVALVHAQTGVGQAAKLILGLVAAGEDPSGFANVDPVPVIENGIDDATGLYGTGVFDHALSVLALVATGSDVPDAAIEAFSATQADNGGWAFDASTDPAMADSNTTALSVQALVAAGQGESEQVADGLAYLESVWLDGGAAYSTLPDTLPDANSTALVIQALAATGADVTGQAGVLAAFQNDSGAFYYNAADTSDNLFATLGAIPALAAGTSGTATPAATYDHVAV